MRLEKAEKAVIFQFNRKLVAAAFGALAEMHNEVRYPHACPVTHTWVAGFGCRVSGVCRVASVCRGACGVGVSVQQKVPRAGGNAQ